MLENGWFDKNETAWLLKNVPGHTERETAAAFYSAFGVCVSKARIHSWKCNHHVRSGTPNGVKKGTCNKVWPKEIADFFIANNTGKTSAEMRMLLKEKFGREYAANQITCFRKNHRLISGITGRFEKGNVPPNKGTHGKASAAFYAHSWKKGHVPKNKAAINTEVTDRFGYIKIKTGEPNKWQFKHVLVWEKANGKRPAGMMIVFKDGNKQNCNIDNLVLISRKVNAVINKAKMRSGNTVLTDTAVAIAELKIKVSGIERKKVVE